MKTEAIGNGVSQVLDSGVAGSHAAGNGDLFFNMLHAIFTSRMQNSQETGNHSGNSTAVPGEQELTDKKEPAGVDEWLAFAAMDDRFANILNETAAAKGQPELSEFGAALIEVAAETGMVADQKTAKENPYLASMLQQWEDLSSAAKEIALQIIGGLLDEGREQKGEQVIPTWLAELATLAGAAKDSSGDSTATLLKTNPATELSGRDVTPGQYGDLVDAVKVAELENGESQKHPLQMKPEQQPAQKATQAVEQKPEQSVELKPEQQPQEPTVRLPKQEPLQTTAQVAEQKPEQSMELKPEQLQGEQKQSLQLKPDLEPSSKLTQEADRLPEQQPAQKATPVTDLKSEQPVDFKPEQPQMEQKQPLQMEPELQAPPKTNNLSQQLMERLGAVTASMEELSTLEQQLASGAVPLLSEKGLSTQTVALIASYLQEGKPLGELSLPILSGLAEHFAGMEIPDEIKVEGTTEKPRPFAAMLARVEKFLNNLLTGGREELGGVTKQFDDLAAEQQLKGVPLPGEPVLGENDSARESAALSGRTEIAVGTRIFSNPAPAFQPNEVMAQVMERLAMLSRPGVQELRMQLHPEHLGNLLIKLRNVRGVLSAEILTQHVAVKELLEGQLDTLRQRFQDMDMQIEEFRVFVGDDEQQKRGEAGDSDKNTHINVAGLKKNDLQLPGTPEMGQRNMEEHRVNYLA